MSIDLSFWEQLAVANKFDRAFSASSIPHQIHQVRTSCVKLLAGNEFQDTVARKIRTCQRVLFQLTESFKLDPVDDSALLRIKIEAFHQLFDELVPLLGDLWDDRLPLAWFELEKAQAEVSACLEGLARYCQSRAVDPVFYDSISSYMNGVLAKRRRFNYKDWNHLRDLREVIVNAYSHEKGDWEEGLLDCLFRVPIHSPALVRVAIGRATDNLEKLSNPFERIWWLKTEIDRVTFLQYSLSLFVEHPKGGLSTRYIDWLQQEILRLDAIRTTAPAAISYEHELRSIEFEIDLSRAELALLIRLLVDTGIIVSPKIKSLAYLSSQIRSKMYKGFKGCSPAYMLQLFNKVPASSYDAIQQELKAMLKQLDILKKRQFRFQAE